MPILANIQSTTNSARVKAPAASSQPSSYIATTLATPEIKSTVLRLGTKLPSAGSGPAAGSPGSAGGSGSSGGSGSGSSGGASDGMENGNGYVQDPNLWDTSTSAEDKAAADAAAKSPLAGAALPLAVVGAILLAKLL